MVRPAGCRRESTAPCAGPLCETLPVVDQGALLSAVQAQRHRLAEVGPPWARSDDDFALVSLPHGDGDVLRDLLVEERARIVIEVGLAYGSSALAIGEALAQQGAEGSRHVVIDPYQHSFHQAGWDAIIAAGLEDVCTLLTEPSQSALPRLVAEGFVADAAFVDGSHIFHRVFVDLVFLRELVRPGGLIVLDDCQWPSVATAARYFERNTGWQPVVLDPPTRLRAFRLPGTRVEPAFDEFNPFHLA
jgi:predicted O-methyltransferase YrrM